MTLRVASELSKFQTENRAGIGMLLQVRSSTFFLSSAFLVSLKSYEILQFAAIQNAWRNSPAVAATEHLSTTARDMRVVRRRYNFLICICNENRFYAANRFHKIVPEIYISQNFNIEKFLVTLLREWHHLISSVLTR